MTPFEAVKQMREITDSGGEFSFSFMSYDRERQESQGMVQVRRAKLRSQSKDVADADRKINYVDLDTGDMRNCWQILIKIFNGQRLEL